jgi:hypothetical protein
MPISEEEARQLLGGDPAVASPLEDVAATDESATGSSRPFTIGEARDLIGGTGVTGGFTPQADEAALGFKTPPEIVARTQAAVDVLKTQRGSTPMARAGVPLDRFSGVQDFKFRAQLHALPDTTAKLQFIAGQLESQGLSSVDHPPRVVDGQLIMPRKDPDTGEVKDYVIDEPGFSMSDIADIANEALPIILGVLGERKAAAKGVSSVLGRLLAGGAGVTTGRFGQSAVARGVSGVAQDVEADLTGALVEGGADVIGGLGVARMLSLAHKVAAPNRILARTPELKAYQESIKRLETELGVPISVSPGEMLLSENMLVFENFARTQIGGEVLREVRDNAMNLRAVLTKELSQFPNKGSVNIQNLDPGAPILRGLWDEVAGKQAAFSKSADDVIDAAVSQYIDTAGKATSMQPLGSAGVVGKALRNKLEATRTNFRVSNEANFAEVDRLAREASNSLGDPVMAEQVVKFDGVADVLDRFKSSATITRVSPGKETVDPLTGRVTKAPPEIGQSEVGSLLPEFFSKWQGAFEEMGQGVSLKTANQVRRAISDDLASSGGFGKKALGSRERALLSDLRQSVTDSLEDAYNSLPGDTAKEALRKANEFYSSNVGKFQTPTVRQLFDSTPEGQVRMPDDEILGRVMTNDVAYRELKEFVGSDPVWSQVKRGALDDILYQASLEGPVNVSDVYRQLKRLPKGVRKDLLGGAEGDTMKTLRMVAGLRLDKSKRRVPFEEMQAWLKEPSSQTRTAVIDAANAQIQLDQEFKSNLKKRVVQKFQSPEMLDSTGTVGKLLDLATPKEAKWAVSQMGSGPMRDKLTQQTLEEMFRRANMTGKINMAGTDIAFSPKGFVNSATIRDQLLGDRKEVYQELLGPEAYQLATDYLAFLSRGDVAKEMAGAAVGTLSRGSMINNMFQKFADNTYRYGKWKLMSSFLAAKPTRRWLLSEGYKKLEVDNALPAILASGAVAAQYATFLADNTVEGEGVAFDAFNKTLEALAPDALFRPRDDAEETPEPTTEP